MGHKNRNIIGSRAISGQNELDKMKNIYDLEGNLREWTLEADSIDQRIYRGGNASVITSSGRHYPASYRNLTTNEPTSSGRIWRKQKYTLFLIEFSYNGKSQKFQNSIDIWLKTG